MADDLIDSIKENAAGPKRAQGDEGSVEMHPIQDQIAADRYVKSQEALTKGKLPIRLVRQIPPGAV